MEKNMRHERIFLNPADDRVFIDTYVVNKNDERDALLIIPGGGYGAVCTENEGEPVALDFVNRGYNTFVLNYRVGKSDHFPNQLLDAASAMIYIRRHAEELKINPRRVFAVGFSAGGHLCGTLATMYDYPEVKAAFGDDYILAKPTGAILGYPVTTLNTNNHVGSFKNLLGKSEEDITEEERHRYSIDTAVNENSSPIYIWHTVEDTLVAHEGTLLTLSAIAKAGIPHMASIFPYGPHGGDMYGKNKEFVPLWRTMSDEWMKTLADSEIDL